MMRLQKLSYLAPFFLAVWMILPVRGLAAEVNVEVVPSNMKPTTGEKITVAISVDVSRSAELLGAVSATLTWNPEVLRYLTHASGKTEGFSKPVANDKKTSEGRLVFASFNPHGGANTINVLNVDFEVIGQAGATADLQVEIKEMVAARTFKDLVPKLSATILGPAENFSVADIPKEYALRQNYPNPFNAGTDIRYELPKTAHVILDIYDSLGAKVRTLVDDNKDAGRYTIKWDGSNQDGNVVSSGIYFYRLKAGDFSAEKKMQFLK